MAEYWCSWVGNTNWGTLESFCDIIVSGIKHKYAIANYLKHGLSTTLPPSFSGAFFFGSRVLSSDHVVTSALKHVKNVQCTRIVPPV